MTAKNFKKFLENEISHLSEKSKSKELSLETKAGYGIAEECYKYILAKFNTVKFPVETPKVANRDITIKDMKAFCETTTCGERPMNASYCDFDELEKKLRKELKK